MADGSSATLAERIKSWDAEIRSSQTHYTNLVAARASRTAQKLAEEVELSELKSELEVLTAQQSVTIQAIALEKTSAGKESQQQQLDEINRQIDEKNEEIAAQENVISDLQSEIDQYAEDIEAVVDRLSISKYFTAAEQKILNLYLIEGGSSRGNFCCNRCRYVCVGNIIYFARWGVDYRSRYCKSYAEW